jgi:hypothetical protein
MLDSTTVGALRRHWEEGWNREDVETIMEPFAKDVVFSSPFITELTGDPAKTTIQGRDTLRDYVAGSFESHPGIRYTLQASHAGSDSIVLIYTAHLPDGSDLPGADYMRVDQAGEVVEWRCHYTPQS